MEKFLLEWPDSAHKSFNSRSQKILSISDAWLAVRSGKISHNLIESYLLSFKSNSHSDSQDRLFALCLLYFSRYDLCPFDSIVQNLRSTHPHQLEVRILTIVSWLWKNDISSIEQAPSAIWAGLQESLLLKICKSYFLLRTGHDELAHQVIADSKNSCLELIMLRAKILAVRGDHQAAVNLLDPIWDRACHNLRFCKQLLQHKMDAKDGRDVKQKAEKALINFGENSQLLYHCTALNLFQRQPGLARRSALYSKFGQVLKVLQLYMEIRLIRMKAMVLLIGQNFCLIL